MPTDEPSPKLPGPLSGTIVPREPLIAPKELAELQAIVKEFGCDAVIRKVSSGHLCDFYGTEAHALMISRLEGLSYVEKVFPNPASGFASFTEVETETAKKREFTLWIDPGSSRVEEITELFSATSDLFKSFGGDGLIFARNSKDHPVVLDPQI